MEKDEKSIKTEQFFIRGNIMTWEGNMLQLSNVSSVSTMGLSDLPFPFLAVIVFLVGLSIFGVSLLLALLFMVVGGGYFYYWYTKNKIRASTINLIILMNSGTSFQFVFQNKSFLMEVLKVLETIICDGGIGNHVISVSISGCEIGGDISVLNKTNIK